MTTAGLFLSRVRDSAAVLTALAAVVAVAALTLGATLASVQQGVLTGSADVLDSAAPQSAAVRISTHLADDDARQTAAALGLVDRLFPAGTVEVHSAQRSLPVDVRGAGVAAVFGVEPALLDDTTITDGRWPAEGVAIQQDAAAALGLAVGDRFEAGDEAAPLALTVAALWRADDPADPAWFADPAVASGHDGDALGVIVVDPATLRTLPTQLFASFTVTATHAALADENRDAVASGFARLHDAVRATAGVVEISSSTEGGLAATLDRISDAEQGARAIAASARVIVALLAVVALVQLGAVLVGSRRGQSDLARARGLSLKQLAALTVGEALLVALPATVLGSLPTLLLFGPGTVPTLAVGAAAVVVATTACLVAVVLLDARARARDAEAGRSPVAYLVAGSLVAVAAAFATVQLYNRGRGAGIDLVAATSPALALVAAAALGAALLYPVAAGLEKRAGRSAGAGAVLAARQLSRQVSRYLVPSLALAIAVASAVFATGLATTWATTERAVQSTAIAGDVRVSLSTDQAAAVTSAPFASLDGVDAAAALLVADVALGSDRLPLVAVRPESARRVLGEPGARLGEAIATTTPDDPGLALPADATEVAATLEFTGDGSTPVSTFDVGVWAADADGSLARVPLVSTAGGFSGALPEGVAPWTVLAVESLRTGKPDPAAAELAVSFASEGRTATVELATDDDRPRAIMPLVDDDNKPLPVVVTTALAERTGLGVGDPLSFTFDPTGKVIDAVVSAVTPRIAGSSSRLALATDLAALDAVTVRVDSSPAETNEVWIATGTPSAVAAAVAREASTTSIVATRASTSSQPILSAALSAFWLAAVAAALLALVAVGAFFTDDVRRRRKDIAVLRALGFSPGQQAAMRGREQLVTTAFAVVVGAIAGAGVTALTVGPFIASTVPASVALVSIVPAFGPLPWLAFCAALIVLASAMFAVLLAAVRRSAVAAVDGSAA
jgi:hypothetical protein